MDFHISIAARTKNTGLNVTDYNSGNKRRYGLNVQAIATATLCFSAVSIIAPGSANREFGIIHHWRVQQRGCHQVSTSLEMTHTRSLSSCDGDVMPANLRMDFVYAPRRAGDTKIRSTLTLVLENCRQYRPE